MAVKRQVKRRIKNTILISVAGLVAICGAIFLFVLSKSILPLLNTHLGSSVEIIKPIGSQTGIEDLKKQILEKNLIFDNLTISSTSGEIIGQIRSGPIIYFSINQSPSWQINSLILILSKTRNDNKKPQVIDLRTLRPIVKY